MPRFVGLSRSSRTALLPRCVWAALWVGFTLGTGTPQAALLSWPKIVNGVGALLFLLFTLGHIVGRTPKGRPILLFTGMMRAWGAIPLRLWLAVALWISAFAWSGTQATMPRLAQEKVGEFGWCLLLCALIFGYAAQGWRRLRWVLSGILTAGDAVLILFVVGQSPLVFPNRIAGVLYAALLLPLAVWDASRTTRATPWSAQMGHFGSRIRVALLLVFLAFSLPPISTWTELSAAWPGVQKLVHQKPLSGWGPGAFDCYFPRFMGEAAPRLPDLIFPGLWARLAVENGCLAAMGALFFVIFITLGGVVKSGAHRNLGLALRASAGLFAILGLWLSPDGSPALQVMFLAVLALTAALRWGPSVGIHSEKLWPHQFEAALLPDSGWSRTFALVFALIGLIFASWRAPITLRQTRAHWLDDQSQQTDDAQLQVKLVNEALTTDPDQPAYWIHLAEARLLRDGAPAARVSASYIRVALHRAVPGGESPDAALWHQIAQLSFQAGDFDRALWMAQRAVHYDPACDDYHLLLAACLARHGARKQATVERQIALRCLNNAPAHPPNRYLRRLKTE